VSFALFDIMTAYLAVINILAALKARDEGSIKGPTYIEIPMYDAAVFSMAYVPVIYLMTGREPKRMGSAHPSIVPYQAFWGSDGKYFILAAANDRLWVKACEALGMPELARDPRFRTNPDRVRNRDELVKLLSEAFSRKPRDHWVRLFREHGVPAAPVYSVGEVFRDPHIIKHEVVVKLPHPSLGEVPQLTYPAVINGCHPMSEKHPPLKGEHMDKVLREFGFSDEEIGELRVKGIIT